MLRCSLQIRRKISQSTIFRSCHTLSTSSYILQREAEEIRIPVPYGEIAGKWWGPRDVQPILTLHGWQDNAGTFDTLIPLLPKHMSFLAIDFPGHGLSSRIPDGMTYHVVDYIYLLKRITELYGWNRVSLLGHSMGAIVGKVFASLFRENVDSVVGIDSAKPQVVELPELIPVMAERVCQTLRADSRNCTKLEPPCYSYDELVERLHEGTNKSVSREAAPFLLNRNIKESGVHQGKFYFARDNRIKYHFNYLGWGQDVSLQLAKQMTMPFLLIKAIQGPYYEKKEHFDEYVDAVKRVNPLFRFEYVDLRHHLHLTDPDSIAPMISEFLHRNWRKRNCSIEIETVDQIPSSFQE